jgi:hypothetical protein
MSVREHDITSHQKSGASDLEAVDRAGIDQ